METPKDTNMEKTETFAVVAFCDEVMNLAKQGPIQAGQALEMIFVATALQKLSVTVFRTLVIRVVKEGQFFS
jgi:hypothetical protein